MGEGTHIRRCQFTEVITPSAFETNKAPSGARAYLEGLNWTSPAIISTSMNRARGTFDDSNSKSGGYAETGVEFHQADGTVELHWGQYDRPPVFAPGEIRGLRIFLDLDGNNAPDTDSGEENIVFIGFVLISAVGHAGPQRGAVGETLTLMPKGWFAGDI